MNRVDAVLPYRRGAATVALSDLAGHESHFDFTAFVDQAAAGSATILRRLLPVF